MAKSITKSETTGIGEGGKAQQLNTASETTTDSDSISVEKKKDYFTWSIKCYGQDFNVLLSKIANTNKKLAEAYGGLK